MSQRGTGWSLVVLLAGCVGQPPEPPGTPTDDDSQGTSSSITTSGAGTLSGGPDTASSPTGSGGEPTEDGTSTQGTSGALLTISDGPAYSFGNIDLGLEEVQIFAVTNEGDADATGIAGLPLSDPFTYPGGFPGSAGTCGETLAPQDTCFVMVSFAPALPGLFADTLAIAHDDGPDLTLSLAGGGTGQSVNLLANPGGEDQGNPPPGWALVGRNEWVAGLLMQQASPHEGQAYIYAHQGPGTDYTLVQDVDVSAWALTIDQGMMRFSFEGWGRTYEPLNDEYRLMLRYQAVDGSELISWSSGWHGQPSWSQDATLANAPRGTRTIRVELGCRKNMGIGCNAYIDTLDLHAVFP